MVDDISGVTDNTPIAAGERLSCFSCIFLRFMYVHALLVLVLVVVRRSAWPRLGVAQLELELLDLHGSGRWGRFNETGHSCVLDVQLKNQA